MDISQNRFSEQNRELPLKLKNLPAPVPRITALVFLESMAVLPHLEVLVYGQEEEGRAVMETA